MSETTTFFEAPDVQVKKIAQFAQKVEGAAALIKAAHPAEEHIFKVHSHARRSGQRADKGTWYTFLAHSCTVRARDILEAIEKFPAKGFAIEAEHAAFEMLSELTPAPTSLTLLLHSNREKAWSELGHHLTMVCSQFERAAAVVEAVPEDSAEIVVAQKSFESASEDLLKRAGGSYTLTDAAKELDVTRQALHKRVHQGSAFGIMIDGKIHLPKLQFVRPKAGKGDAEILDGIGKVTKLFMATKAGAWAALEFLIDVDPNLARAPIDALKDGQIDAAAHAARSHLGMDEG